MPRIRMTRSVRIALIVLRAYLILLLGVIILKFILSVGSAKEPPKNSPSTNPHAGSFADHSPVAILQLVPTQTTAPVMPAPRS